MNSRLLIVPLILLGGLSACQSPEKTTSPAHTASSSPVAASTTPQRKVNLAVRNNAFALLKDLLDDEKHLSKVLLIKFESGEVDRLITQISKIADEGANLLETYSKSDPAFAQAKVDLPPGEATTR